MADRDHPAPVRGEREAAPAATEAAVRAVADTAPQGMVLVPGGTVHVGSEEGSVDEAPVFEARVDPFYLDRHPVTVGQFRRFVEDTRYVTDAERLGDGAVLELRTGAWRLVPGATWRRPLGPDGAAARDDHPVTQVSWNDAMAYARWLGRRLPTEVEWEHAARGAANRRDRYAWGNTLVVGGRHMANTGERRDHAGHATMDAPVAVGGRQQASAEDGHLLTSPVGAYGKTTLGLTDMGGNVWEWTDSWYRPYDEVRRGMPFQPHPGSERVQRGGSFLCSTDYCHGYRVSARSHATPETSLFHTGFRTAIGAAPAAAGARGGQ